MNETQDAASRAPERARRALLLPELPLALDEAAIRTIAASEPGSLSPWLPGMIWPSIPRPDDPHARRTLVIGEHLQVEVPARMLLLELAELLELPDLLRAHQRGLGLVALARVPADARERAGELVLFCDPRGLDLGTPT